MTRRHYPPGAVTRVGTSAPAPRPPLKAANIVAEAIERDILAGRHPQGAPIGTEAELCVRYGVGRWIVREAIAIVQNDGLVAVRRGRGGGALVNGTPEGSLAAAICGFLLYTRLENERIVAARLVIDRLLYRTAAARLDQPLSERAVGLLAGHATNRPAVAVAIDIVEEIVALADNPLLGVLALALSKLTLCRLALHGLTLDADGPEAPRLLALREAQLAAVIGADGDTAVAAAEEVAALWRVMFAASRRPVGAESDMAAAHTAAQRIARVLHPESELKPSGLVATLLMLDAMDLPSDQRGMVGAEPVLTARYGVSRSLLREGIRILERDGFLMAEQGRGGGIRIGEPDASALTARAVRVFRHRRITPEQIRPVATAVRLHALDLLLERPEAARALASQLLTLADGGAAPRAAIFAALAAATGDGFVLLVEAICSALEVPSNIDKHLLVRCATALQNGLQAFVRREFAKI